jgi:SAM-dependent methyltransferase
VPIRWAATGYGNGGGRQLACAATLDALEASVRALDLASPTFRIAVRCIPRSQPGSMVAKTRLGRCIRGLVSYDDPQLRLLLVVSSQGYRLLLEQSVAPDEAAWLGAAHKKHNYVASLPVRIAKAVLNCTLRPGDTMLDAFCGTGTLPLLAAWAGHRAFGSDLSAASVSRAAANLAQFGREATLTCVDALVVDQPTDCIVSNLPYGIYCHLAPDTLRAILRNLGRLAPRVTLVAADPIDDALLAAGYAIEEVIRVEPERFERLVYVTRSPG